ncbi:hypothetical protein BT69DRAFT_1338303 [Atractiella rhizophila]|nr:hypothetical protein BT69DRAFT_1338303 [Atractiella rhizophila]
MLRPDVHLIIKDVYLKVEVSPFTSHFPIVVGQDIDWCHVSTNAWTLRNHMAWLAMLVHYWSGTEVKEIILEFLWLSDSHTGRYLAGEIVKVLEQYGIDGKLMGLVSDRARIPNLVPQSCAQPVAKDLILPFMKEKKKEGEETERFEDEGAVNISKEGAAIVDKIVASHDAAQKAMDDEIIEE